MFGKFLNTEKGYSDYYDLIVNSLATEIDFDFRFHGDWLLPGGKQELFVYLFLSSFEKKYFSAKHKILYMPIY